MGKLFVIRKSSDILDEEWWYKVIMFILVI